MLDVIGAASLDDLLDQTVPASIRTERPLALPRRPLGGRGARRPARARPTATAPRTSLIGMGYSPTHTPGVIQRNVLENPAWYTAYTPYQAEISQGRLEALLNFQTMVAELTGLPVTNASLLDEATAAAEAMAMARRLSRGDSNRFVVHHDTHPQTIAVLTTRAEPVGIDVVVGDVDAVDEGCFGALFSLPTSTGAVVDWRAAIERVHDAGGLAVVATDLLACVLTTPPGQLGADIAIGSAQRFGVPMMFGGPHAAFIAAREGAARSLPGRIVGVSTDTAGRPALRLALQTREQHIRREKATSNICTAQVLLANIAGFYAAYHGPAGLRRIAERTHRMASIAADALRAAGLTLRHDTWFDTITVDGVDADAVLAAARGVGIDLRRVDAQAVGLSFDETTTLDVLATVLPALGATLDPDRVDTAPDGLPPVARRTDEFLTQSVFNRYHTEHGMLRYLRRLADADLALDRTMIPLGSCTMKLNATTEMAPITWPEFAEPPPVRAARRASTGLRELIAELESWLAEITGYDAVSLQPNAGSQGELAGLLAIGAYHRSRGDDGRTVCLIPSSAHGTNAASAVMAGMGVVVVATDGNGNVDLADLRDKLAKVGDRLAAIMLTYPSTHGVFEEAIGEICDAVHDAGGQVYVDGANLNALVGVARPGHFGADVSHLNLHKTFCIPHGGGGPGVGPVAVRQHLTPFLPADPLVRGRARRRPGVGGPLRIGRDPADLVGVHRADGRRGARPCDRRRDRRRELRRHPPAPALPCALHRRQGPRRARVHPRSATDHQGHRRHRRRRRQAADRLRLPRPDDELPRRRDVDGRADGERDAGRAGPLLRGDDRHPRRDRPRGRRRVAARGRARCAWPRTRPRTSSDRGTALRARARCLSAARAAGRQVLPAGVTHRRCRRRPQPGLLL